jgi:hypothetical protein
MMKTIMSNKGINQALHFVIKNEPNKRSIYLFNKHIMTTIRSLSKTKSSNKNTYNKSLIFHRFSLLLLSVSVLFGLTHFSHVFAVEEFETERAMLDFIDETSEDSLAVISLFRPDNEHEKFEFVYSDAEETFHDYGHEDVIFARANKLKGSKETPPKTYVLKPHYKETKDLRIMNTTEQTYDLQNLVNFIFYSLIPPYAKWPVFPKNRGTEDEVQRANLHAKNDMPKVFVLTKPEAAVDNGVVLHEVLTEVGSAIAGLMVIIQLSVKDKSFLRAAVYEGEEDKIMEWFETNDFVLVGYDKITNIRESMVFPNMESLTFETMLSFCSKYVSKIGGDVLEGKRSPFPLKKSKNRRSKNTVGLGKHRGSEHSAEDLEEL